MRRILGSVIIKNVGPEPYRVEELLGYMLEPGAEVDLMDSKLSFFYSDWSAANKLVTTLESAKLNRDIQAGKIQVILNQRSLPAHS